MLCQNGDIITIAGVYSDGTHAKNEGPYDEKPLQRFELRGPEGQHDIAMFQLIPIDDEGNEITEWTWAGEYRIVRNH